MTKVIHIKDSQPSDPEHIYIGRPGRGNSFLNGSDGRFGNPIEKGKLCQICGGIHQDGGSTLDCYRVWLFKKLQTDKNFAAEVAALFGKTLVCFCAPNPCHGTVLAKAAAWLQSQAKPAVPEKARPAAIHDPLRIVCGCGFTTHSDNLPATLNNNCCPVCGGNGWHTQTLTGQLLTAPAVKLPPARSLPLRFIATADITPANDGVDHVNVYSKGQTELGRLLSHYSAVGFELDGRRYASVESFWMVTRMTSANQAAEIYSAIEISTAASLPGYKAKEFLRGLGRDSGQPPSESQLRRAYEARFAAMPRLKELLIQCDLPLAHYYVYGTKAVDAAPWGWTAELSALMREEFLLAANS